MPTDLASRRVTVMGLGHFGGGAGIARWLVQQGAQVLLTDLQNETQLAQPLRAIDDLRPPVTLRLGEHQLQDFTNADLVIANPAVARPWENPYLLAASNAGVLVTTEMRLLTERINRDRVIGITGTAGKSTTAAMVHHILNRAGCTAHLGGNIGGSLLDRLDAIGCDDWIVLELSSFMLYWLGRAVGSDEATPWSPHVAALTNIHANHLDWHGSFEHYQQSKHNLFRYQQPGDVAVRPGDAPPLAMALRVPGAHNQANASLAVHVAHQAIGISPADAADALSDFTGLPHRLALIGEHEAMRFYDDSKSTTPAATVLAVQAFDDPGRIHLIAGGYDKGSDLSPISDLAPQLAGLYTIGATGPGLAGAAAANGSRAFDCQQLDVAVQRAIERMGKGDILLLSPGCASWDQFANYQQRAEQFVQAVSAHLPAGSLAT